MKTPEETRNEVAVKRGWVDWYAAEMDIFGEKLFTEMQNEAMKEYASQFIDLAAESAEMKPTSPYDWDIDKDSILKLKDLIK